MCACVCLGGVKEALEMKIQMQYTVIVKHPGANIFLYSRKCSWPFSLELKTFAVRFSMG